MYEELDDRFIECLESSDDVYVKSPNGIWIKVDLDV